MKILVLTSSPRKKGTSNTLVKEFIKGTIEAGHQIELIDLANSNIHPCRGCNYCGMDGECIQKDDMKYIIDKMLEVDAICMSSPVYYYNVSAQLKVFIDRFYSKTIRITNKHLKAVFITTAWNNDEATMQPVHIYMNKLFDYMNFENRGMLFGSGCGEVSMISKHYLKEAYKLGKNI